MSRPEDKDCLHLCYKEQDKAVRRSTRYPVTRSLISWSREDGPALVMSSKCQEIVFRILSTSCNPRVGEKEGPPKQNFQWLYDRDLWSADLSFQPQWEEVTTEASLHHVWRGFIDTLCAMLGPGGTKLWGKIRENFYHDNFWCRAQSLLE